MFQDFMINRDHRASLMGKMMCHMDVDIGRLAVDCLGTTIERAARRCASCRTASQCAAHLADESAEPKDTATFCPNHDVFVSMRRGA